MEVECGFILFVFWEKNLHVAILKVGVGRMTENYCPILVAYTMKNIITDNSHTISPLGNLF